MTRCITPVVLSLLIGSSLLRAQTTWIVDLANGPGTHFTDLPEAVQAASPGDIIRVRPSPFWPFQFYRAAVIDKPLSILGDRLFPPIFLGVFEVHSIPQGQTFFCSSIRHGTVETRLQALFGATVRGWVCHDNSGTIHFDRLEYGWDPALFDNMGNDGRGILIERCNLAIISRSMIWSSAARTTVCDSTFIATNSQFRESTPYIALHLQPETMFLERSTAWLVDCVVRGTDGAPHPGWMYGKDGVVLCNSTLRVGGFSHLSGGMNVGGSLAFGVWTKNFQGCWDSSGVTTPRLFIDPRATVLGTPMSHQVVLNTDPVPAVAWSISSAQTTLTTLHYATANSLTLLASGPLLANPLAGPLGTLFLDPAGLFVLDVGFATAQGVRSTILAVPASVALPTNWPIQAVELTPTGSLLLSQAVIAGVY